MKTAIQFGRWRGKCCKSVSFGCCKKIQKNLLFKNLKYADEWEQERIYVRDIVNILLQIGEALK